MFPRLLSAPAQSAFLFGPRATGKSTWLRQHYSDATFYDLLDTSEALRLNKEPETLFRELSALAPESVVVIDEVQKAPTLLNEVHRLIESRGLRFLLSGSSARKLRRGGVNLLAGRALMLQMFPLVSAERGFGFDIAQTLRYGALPLAVTGADPEGYLRAYAETYLEQEIRAEALTRNIGAFARFLEIAARQNGQATNASAIARDAGISRHTVQSHFEILVDTLIGHWLPAWKLKSATKQVQHSKFYFFDSGVARALSGRLPYPPTQEELGPLLETFILHELRAYLSYTGRHYIPHYWRTYDGVEVDLLCETTKGYTAIEIKAASRWEKRFNRGLHRLRQDLGRDKTQCYGVYLGDREALWDDIHILPATDFLQRLWDGQIAP